MSVLPYITEEQIQARIQDLALEIDEFCKKNHIEELRLICVLRGSIHFFSDLSRKLRTPCRYDFIGLSSYGSETTSSSNVQLTYPSDLEQLDVLVVEDIVDTGNSMHHFVVTIT